MNNPKKKLAKFKSPFPPLEYHHHGLHLSPDATPQHQALKLLLKEKTIESVTNDNLTSTPIRSIKLCIRQLRANDVALTTCLLCYQDSWK